MKIEFIKPPIGTSLNKATIHRTGKLGFSQGAQEKMGLDAKKYLTIGINKEDKKDTSLYVLVSDEGSENSLQVSKAGKYYYINSKALFDEMNLDYKTKKLIYDIIEIDYEGTKIFKLIRREMDRKTK